MSNNKQSSVDAYCNGCNAFICDELVTFEETCSNCGTKIEYFEEENETPFDTYHSALIEWESGGLDDVPTYWLEKFKQDLEKEINRRKNNDQQ